MRLPFFGAVVALLGLGTLACSGGDDTTSNDPTGNGSGAAAGSSAAGSATGGTSASAGSSGTAAGGSATAGSGGGGGSGGQIMVDLSEHTYAANDANIRISGRVDWTNPTVARFSAVGTYIKARFAGTSVTLLLDDENRYDIEQNYYEVILDDQAPQKIAASKDQTSFVLASDLAPTEHTLTIAKRTEAAVGYSDFSGLKIMGELLPAPAAPTRRIEFIGDSITCGSGNEAANNSAECSEGGWGQPYHNNYLAYGPVLSRDLDAEYHVTAVSGIGLVRNYSSLYDGRPMPEVYDLMYVELMDSMAWNAADWVPDAVVVALGTNDYSTGDSARPKMDKTTFTTAYIAFVEKLRGYYPNAHIFAVSSPMLGDGWPDATDTFLTDQRDCLADVAAHFAGEGDTNVHNFSVTKLFGEGCGTHPSVAQHASMAAELGTFIQSTMGW